MKKIAIAIITLGLTACGIPPPLSYEPQIQERVPGRFNILPFTVDPVVEGQGAGGFAQWQKLYFNDSFQMEFESMGNYAPDAPCTLTGSVDRVSLSGGHAPTMQAETNITYRLLGRNGEPIYTKQTLAARELSVEHSSGFTTVLNRTTTDTIRQVIRDDGFASILKDNCPL